MYDLHTWLDILLRLTAAIACGAVLGWDREAHDKPAGLRTHMLVALGAAAFTITTFKLDQQAEIEQEVLRLDPSRVVQGIVGGIGFLGAGSIIRGRGGVEGITTAATIWVVGAVGISCGAGWYQISIAVTVLAALVLTGVGFFQHRFLGPKSRRTDSSREPPSSDAPFPPP